jgi:NHL repeat-containing protein
MKRRVFLYASIAVGVTALSSTLISLAAEQPAPGTIITVAGTGQPGFSGDNGPATQARLDQPISIVTDAAGNLFFGDGGNHRVRKVSPDGTITTYAGTGVRGFSGDGGPATQARLGDGLWLALDGAGNLYLSDGTYQRVRKVSPDGIITTVAGSGPTDSDLPGAFSGDGGPATEARLYYPTGLAVDATGNLFIADAGNHRVRKVSPDGTISTVAGSGPIGPDKGYAAGDGGPALAATLRGPCCLAVDGAGNLFLTDVDIAGTGAPYTGPKSRVRKVSTDGMITTVAGNGVRGFSGDGGPAVEAGLDDPFGVAVDSAGNLFISDVNNHRVRKVDANGIITTVAGTGKNPYAGDGVLATATGLHGPAAVGVDAAGNLLICDTGQIGADAGGLGTNERVLKVFGVAAPGLLAGLPFPSRP